MTNHSVLCPYCGEPNEIAVDEWGGRMQEYVEDCQICCQPWQVVVHAEGEEEPTVELRTLDG